MKKNIIGILIIMVIIISIQVIGFIALEVNDEKFLEYSQYYFSKLQKDEKKIYVKIDEAITNGEKKATIRVTEIDGLNEKINKVVTAYFYDNPEYYYVSNEYVITTKDFKIFKYADIEFNYLVDMEKELSIKNQELEWAIEKILNKVIKTGMNDFQKEVAIHDELIKRIRYYEYQDINSIPAIKHTAYGALVDNEAVCDGYSKAFKILLERVGIDSVILTGEVSDVAHAWNVVKLDGNHYHVDVTSDKMQEQNVRYASHIYFNVTDAQIQKTHIISRNYIYPECNENDKNYYIINNYYIEYDENMYNKLYDITSRQQNSDILEVKVDSRYNVQHIIDALYDINFNNWRSSGKTKVTYTKSEDVYMFIK